MAAHGLLPKCSSDSLCFPPWEAHLLQEGARLLSASLPRSKGQTRDISWTRKPQTSHIPPCLNSQGSALKNFFLLKQNARTFLPTYPSPTPLAFPLGGQLVLLYTGQLRCQFQLSGFPSAAVSTFPPWDRAIFPSSRHSGFLVSSHSCP